MTGYGLAFSRNSKYLDMFNKQLLEYRDNGMNIYIRTYIYSQCKLFERLPCICQKCRESCVYMCIIMIFNYSSVCHETFTGDLERLRRYWMTGSCKAGREIQKSSDPLALEQFLSAFLLLMAGILFAALLLLMEYLYFKYLRDPLATSDRCQHDGCCALLSLVSSTW